MPEQLKRVLIADDETAARAQLRSVIDPMPGLTVVAEVASGAAAIAGIVEHCPDIVFLDIDMPEIDGFAVAKATEHLMYQLVFVTAHHQYALRAFDTHAIDYLLKPARPSVIRKCLTKLLRHEVMTLERTSEKTATPRLVLTDSGTSHFLDTDDVLYIEGLGRYRRIHLSEEGAKLHKLETLLSDTTLDEFAEQLVEQGFIRVHRSYLVNLSGVTALKSRGRAIELNLTGIQPAIPVARSRVAALKTALGMAKSRSQIW